MNAAFFCLGNILVLWIAARCAVGLATRRLDFAVGWTALFPVCAIFMMILGGVTGQLYPGRICLGLAALAVVVMVRAGWRIPKLTFGALELPRSTIARLAVAAVIAFAAIPIFSFITNGTGYFIDDFGYHTVAVASWIQHGAFRQIMPQYEAYFPLNAELLSGWFALPFHHDAMVGLAGLVWLALAAVSAGGLARLAGGDATAGLITAAAVLASTPLVWQTRTFSACDLAGSASLLAAAYFTASSTRTQRLDQAIVAGLLVGLALGAKPTFLPPACLLCLYPLRAPMGRRSRLKFTATMFAAAAVLGSVWYLRNWINTGNPLFPAEVGPFAGPLTHAEQHDLKLSNVIPLVGWTWRLWGHMIYDYLDWPVPFGILCVAGYVRAIVVDCRRSSEASEERALRRLLLACGMVQFVLHFFAPLSIGGGYHGGRLLVFARYVMPWFLFGLAAAAPLLDARSRFGFCWQALAAAGLVMCWPGDGASRLCCLAVVLAGLALLAWWPAFLWRPLAWIALLGVWPILALLGPKLRAETDRKLRETFHTANGSSLGSAILAMESLPPGTRLTRFANQEYFNAPIYGREWQFHPIFTDGNGVPLVPVHLQFRADRALTIFGPKQRRFPPPKQFIDNLRAAGISDVFVTKFDTAEWPPQQRLLEESREATVSFSDGGSTLWHLATPAPLLK